MTVRSRYRIIPVLLILLSNLLLGGVCWLLLSIILKDPEALDDLAVGGKIFMGLIFLTELMLLHILMVGCRRIKTDSQRIVFIHPFFPFIRRSFKWKKLDYHLTVMEYAKYNGRHETVWIIRRGRVKACISSLYIRNFMEIKDSLHIPDRGERHITWYKKTLCLLRLSKVPVFYSRYRS